MTNQQVWLPPDDLWQWGFLAALLGLPGVPPETDLNGLEYMESHRARLAKLVERFLRDSDRKRLGYLLDEYLPGLSRDLLPVLRPEDVAVQILSWDAPEVDDPGKNLPQYLDNKISLKQLKENFIQLRDEDKDILDREEANEAALNLGLWEYLQLTAV